MTIEILSEDRAAFDELVITDTSGATWVKIGEPEDNGNGYFTVEYTRVDPESVA